jgi:hypothetical protein
MPRTRLSENNQRCDTVRRLTVCRSSRQGEVNPSPSQKSVRSRNSQPLACIRPNLPTIHYCRISVTPSPRPREHGPCIKPNPPPRSFTSAPMQTFAHLRQQSASSLRGDTPKSGDRMEPFRLVHQPSKQKSQSFDMAPLFGPCNGAEDCCYKCMIW